MGKVIHWTSKLLLFSIAKHKDHETFGLRQMTDSSINLLGKMLFSSATWGRLISIVYLQTTRDLFEICSQSILYWCGLILVTQVFLLMLNGWLCLLILGKRRLYLRKWFYCTMQLFFLSLKKKNEKWLYTINAWKRGRYFNLSSPRAAVFLYVLEACLFQLLIKLW